MMRLSRSNPTVGLSFTETRKVFQALAFAAHKHRDQRRKNADASPYINHPIALADILVNEGGITDHVVLCAAILHDTIEDWAEKVVAGVRGINPALETAFDKACLANA
jgi:(p)ppGpp synthase/HD superfamily hydrolase